MTYRDFLSVLHEVKDLDAEMVFGYLDANTCKLSQILRLDQTKKGVVALLGSSHDTGGLVVNPATNTLYPE